MFLLDWIRKRLGYHVCEEFTQWETYKGEFSRVSVSMQEKMRAGWVDRIEYTKRWQERRCTICGAIQQRGL